MGIFADKIAESFFEQGPLGLPCFQREVGELFTNVFDATHVDLLEHFALLTLPGVSAIDILGVPEPLALFFWRKGSVVGATGNNRPKKVVNFFLVPL